MQNKIRVLIVDDHVVVREGLRTILSMEPDIELVGEAKDGFEAVTKARKLSPDVILMDLITPGKNGIEAIREIRETNPKARVLVLTSFSEDDLVFHAIEAGALGFMLKDTTSETLTQAVRIVYRDEPSLHPTVARKLMQARSPKTEADEPLGMLTAREQEVRSLLGLGLSNRDIAERLVLSELTVRSHVSNILAKLNLENRTQAALYALRRGLTDKNL
jgi:two-component system, NarL family, response regulator LiaR